MRDAQTERGEVPLLAPSNEHYGYVGKPAFKPVNCCGATPIWDAFWFVIPWESYQRFGNRASLERAYPAMQKYLDEWIPQWTAKDGDEFAHTLTAGLGDWVPPKGVPTVNALSSTAYYARLATIAAATARVLGRVADADRYDGLAQRIRADFNARFLSAGGLYREKPEEGFVQTSHILPLAFDLVPTGQRDAVAARLAQDVTGARGGNPWVGVIGARHILPVLSATGHFDVACSAATQTDEPSWGYWTSVAKFTALGEHWPATTRSRNHHFFGAIVEWMYEDLAGIRPLAPGYARIAFTPAPASCGIERVAASYESVRGTIAISWHYTVSALDLDVTVPPNATGRVFIPAASPDDVAEISGSVPVPARSADGITVVGRDRDRILLDVGSGRYRFRARR
jgi:alpha-L-rhamnosidase